MACHISVRDIDFHPSDTGVRIRVFTDVPSHLFIRLSLIKPLIHKQPSLRRGVAFAEDVRFCFTVFEDNEQNEWGDTVEHTWWKPDWPVCTTKWLYVWGSRSGVVCVSTTAPFQYHNDGVAPVPPWGLIFHEPWSRIFPEPFEMGLIFLETWDEEGYLGEQKFYEPWGEDPFKLGQIFLEEWSS
ncbi:hypothetical protein ES703_18351 [subsurface metagenome]